MGEKERKGRKTEKNIGYELEKKKIGDKTYTILGEILWYEAGWDAMRCDAF